MKTIGPEVETCSPEGIGAPAPRGLVGRSGGPLSLLPLLHALVLAAAVVALAAGAGRAVKRWLGQPAVLGEIAVGLGLGPSLLGWLWPAGEALLFPPELHPFLAYAADIAVVLFLFLVGVEADLGAMARNGRRTFGIAAAGAVGSWILGVAFAPLLFSRYLPAGQSPWLFAAFFGVALATTAFPVLARLLRDQGLAGTPLGHQAIALAAINDVLVWSVLAVVVAAVQGDALGAARVVPPLLLFFGVLFLVVRPAAAALAERSAVPGWAVPVSVLAALLGAWISQQLGLHLLFGAFAVGLVVPPHSALARRIRGELRGVVEVVLVPLFFVWCGLGVDASAATWADVGVGVAVLGVACLGKIGATWLAASRAGLPRADALALGVLMNTRGLVALVVLDVGRGLGLVSPALFAVMVIVAETTTAMTAPLLARVRRSEPAVIDGAEVTSSPSS